MAMKRNEEVIGYIATTKMTLENTTLSERSQSQRTTYFMIPLYETSRVGKSIVIESRLTVAWGWVRGLEGIGGG